MYRSEQFGRHFWVDDNLDLLSCPTNVDLTADIANWDWFVSYNNQTASFWDGMILVDADSLQIA